MSKNKINPRIQKSVDKLWAKFEQYSNEHYPCVSYKEEMNIKLKLILSEIKSIFIHRLQEMDEVITQKEIIINNTRKYNTSYITFLEKVTGYTLPFSKKDLESILP